MKRGLNLLIITTFLFSLGLISSLGESCYITDRASCTETVVMGISSLGNAHGELASEGNYNYVLCCTFAGSLTCDGSNKIIGLSSTTNAHAETPTEATYSNDVCYSDLNCISTSFFCGSQQVPDYPLSIFSLSDYTNAHIGEINDYSINICCTSESVGPASCGNNIIDPGETCDGSEWDPISSCSDFDAFTGGTLLCDASCQFDTSQCTGGIAPGFCGDNIINTGETCDGSEWGPITSCSDFDEFISGSLNCYSPGTGSECRFDTSQCTAVLDANTFWSKDGINEISILDVVIGMTIIKLVLENSGLSQGTEVNFNIYEEDAFLDDFIRTVNTNVDNDGAATAEWTITQGDIDKTSDYDEFYFEVNGQRSGYLSLTFIEGPNCNEIITCMDYSEQNLCENDAYLCQVAPDSMPEEVDCDDPFIDCFCSWNVSEGECNPAFTVTSEDCGDNIINAGETCDGSDWGLITSCSEFDDFTGGILSCYSPGTGNECRFDTIQCTGGSGGYCGDNIIDAGETCDGSELGTLTCSNFDVFTGGTLSCDSCSINTISCTGGTAGSCGDGTVNTGEQCDGGDWGLITSCSDFGDFTGGILSCNSDCEFDTIQCTGGSGGYCGDNIIDTGETCDGSDWGSISSCTDFDLFTGGSLSCDSSCHFETSQCTGGIEGGGEVVIGTCTYFSETGDNCDDGFLSYSWTANWDGTPESKPLECIDGSKTIECPAEVQLPFFGIYNFIAVVLIIAFIYIILILRGKKLK